MSESYYPAHASRPVEALKIPGQIEGATQVAPGLWRCDGQRSIFDEPSSFSGAARSDFPKIDHKAEGRIEALLRERREAGKPTRLPTREEQIRKINAELEARGQTFADAYRASFRRSLGG